MLAFVLLAKNEKMLVTYEKMKGEWFRFIQEANSHTINKQCLGIARSY